MRILSITAKESRVSATSIVAIFMVLAAWPAWGGAGSGGRNAPKWIAGEEDRDYVVREVIADDE
jgi:hypothetical protein